MNYKVRIGITLVLVVGLCSCAPLNVSGLKGNKISFGSNVTAIQKIKATPDKQGTVYVQGKVERKVPLLKRWAYLINDATDQIWIVTNESNFQQGETVVMQGKLLYQSIPIAEKDFGEVYLEEK
ncbi:hypothetical protein [Anabaena sp. UHCC 0399]|uniref:hypothetical protein n=1 Tax=Anabaena sp. UHCC 0399 TaxID=3110238 RepID=UPI0016884F03|nr:hypothetical protein [Anabaena sp. UHCC 0399]MBD2361740.1 hypothetical protein [Anabaena minutissima FACHB-250]MEA5569195.1 hypothetical protein [Anabaena sp. UHCC 0399]